MKRKEKIRVGCGSICNVWCMLFFGAGDRTQVLAQLSTHSAAVILSQPVMFYFGQGSGEWIERSEKNNCKMLQSSLGHGFQFYYVLYVCNTS